MGDSHETHAKAPAPSRGADGGGEAGGGGLHQALRQAGSYAQGEAMLSPGGQGGDGGGAAGTTPATGFDAIKANPDDRWALGALRNRAVLPVLKQEMAAAAKEGSALKQWKATRFPNVTGQQRSNTDKLARVFGPHAFRIDARVKDDGWLTDTVTVNASVTVAFEMTDPKSGERVTWRETMASAALYTVSKQARLAGREGGGGGGLDVGEVVQDAGQEIGVTVQRDADGKTWEVSV